MLQIPRSRKPYILGEHAWREGQLLVVHRYIGTEVGGRQVGRQVVDRCYGTVVGLASLMLSLCSLPALVDARLVSSRVVPRSSKHFCLSPIARPLAFITAF